MFQCILKNNIADKKLNVNVKAEPCCRADTAECLACVAGLEVTEYCSRIPTTIGCDGL